MSSIPPLNAARVLKQYGLWAAKGMGQNFLEDQHALQQIADAAEIVETDMVLEVGPGLGSLTRFLSTQAREVVAVEVDPRLIPVLRGLLKDYRNVRLVEGDILELSPTALGLADSYLVAANIPYNITSALLRHLLSWEPRPKRMVLTVQNEVAERICARPPRMSLLSLSVQLYGSPAIVARIPAGAFFPIPNVDSAVVRIDVYPSPIIAEELLPPFFDVIRAGFSQKRKMLRNALSGGLRISPAQASALLLEAGIDPQRRAETLTLQEWELVARLSKAH